MVEAGLDVLQGVRAATAEGAELLGVDDRGVLRRGCGRRRPGGRRRRGRRRRRPPAGGGRVPGRPPGGLGWSRCPWRRWCPDDRRQLPEELVALREAIRTFIQREIAPEGELRPGDHRDRHLRRPAAGEAALRKRSAAEGYYSLFMPEEAGGGGVGYLGLVLCVEECMRRGCCWPCPAASSPASRADSSCSTAPRAAGALSPADHARPSARGLLRPGPARRRLGRDPDPHPGRAGRRRLGHQRPTHFITHGAEADYVILFAVTDPGKGARGGISCFLVDTDCPGFEVGRRQRTMYDEHQAELVFTDCPVGDDALLGREGLRLLLGHALDQRRPGCRSPPWPSGWPSTSTSGCSSTPRCGRRSAAGSAPTSTCRG